MDAEFIAIVRRRIASSDPYHEGDDVKYPELAVKWVQALDARMAEDDMLAHALVTPPAQLESADVIRIPAFLDMEASPPVRGSRDNFAWISDQPLGPIGFDEDRQLAQPDPAGPTPSEFLQPVEDDDDGDFGAFVESVHASMPAELSLPIAPAGLAESDEANEPHANSGQATETAILDDIAQTGSPQPISTKLEWISTSYIPPREQHLRLLHPPGSRGRVTRAFYKENRDGETRWHEEISSPGDMPTSRYLGGEEFVSMSRFHGRRREGNLAEIGAMWADVDYYKRKAFERMSPEDMAAHLLYRLAEGGVPTPSYIMSTGRGLCLVWLHSAIPGKRALRRWRACMDYLWGPKTSDEEDVRAVLLPGRSRRRTRPEDPRIAELKARRADIWRGVGLDRKPKDPTRVFRTAGSYNAHSGTKVRLVWPHSWDLVQRYDFDYLAEVLLPYTQRELEARKASNTAEKGRQAEAPKATRHRLSLEAWWQNVVEDLHRLREHRGGIAQGFRNAWLFLAANAMSWIAGGNRDTWVRDLAELAGFTSAREQREALVSLGSVERRLRAAEAGAVVLYDGREIDPRYRFKASTMIDYLEITEEEAKAAGLRILVPNGNGAPASDAARAEAYRRRMGAASRVCQQTNRVAAGHEAIRLRAEGKTVEEIAALLGRGRTWVYKAIAEAKNAGPAKAEGEAAAMASDRVASSDLAVTNNVRVPSRIIVALPTTPTRPSPARLSGAPSRHLKGRGAPPTASQGLAHPGGPLSCRPEQEVSTGSCSRSSAAVVGIPSTFPKPAPRPVRRLKRWEREMSAAGGIQPTSVPTVAAA